MSNHTTENATRSINQPVIRAIIPTGNKDKVAIIKKYFEQRVSEQTKVKYAIVPVESDVGEQPYNAAGGQGAYNRIHNAVTNVEADTEAHEGFVVAIENFIQVEDIDRPTDFGVVLIHNVTHNTYAVNLSEGVTIDKAVVEAAK
ncbi:uncharacterized protein B0I36DRAFT_436644, partial [Microdochium trichocladiopsis]